MLHRRYAPTSIGGAYLAVGAGTLLVGTGRAKIEPPVARRRCASAEAVAPPIDVAAELSASGAAGPETCPIMRARPTGAGDKVSGCALVGRFGFCGAGNGSVDGAVML
jgi:hypothetical protein